MAEMNWPAVALGSAILAVAIYRWLESGAKKRKGRGATRPKQTNSLTCLKDIPRKRWCQGPLRGELRILRKEDFR